VRLIRGPVLPGDNRFGSFVPVAFAINLRSPFPFHDPSPSSIRGKKLVVAEGAKVTEQRAAENS